MTAPAPILLPAAAPSPAARDAAPAAAGVPQSAGFAAVLAGETAAADQTPGALQATGLLLPTPAVPTDDLALPTEDPGKPLPPIRQKLAALLAATSALIGTKGEPSAAGEGKADAEPAARCEAPEGENAPAAPPILTVLALALPAPAAPQSPAATAPKAAKATAAPPLQTTTAPTAPAASDTVAQLVAPPAAPNATPHAAFIAAGLVFEREAAARVSDAPPPPADAAPEASPTATQIAARAQPQGLAAMLAALGGTPERSAPRKPGTLAETQLAITKPGADTLPDTAAALALAQPSTVSAAPAAPDTQAASAPQPLSFDQLVESIARARDGVDQAGPVAVAMRHQDFGRISLRIESDGAGLSVAMASPDPAFAPAVAAAHAAATNPEPQRGAPTAPHAETAGQGQTGTHQSGSGQQRQPAAAQRPATNPARPSVSETERRSGIFA